MSGPGIRASLSRCTGQEIPLSAAVGCGQCGEREALSKSLGAGLGLSPGSALSTAPAPTTLRDLRYATVPLWSLSAALQLQLDIPSAEGSLLGTFHDPVAIHIDRTSTPGDKDTFQLFRRKRRSRSRRANSWRPVSGLLRRPPHLGLSLQLGVGRLPLSLTLLQVFPFPFELCAKLNVAASGV